MCITVCAYSVRFKVSLPGNLMPSREFQPEDRDGQPSWQCLELPVTVYQKPTSSVPKKCVHIGCGHWHPNTNFCQIWKSLPIPHEHVNLAAVLKLGPRDAPVVGLLWLGVGAVIEIARQMHLYIHIYIYIHIYTHIYIHTHTHTHIYMEKMHTDNRIDAI